MYETSKQIINKLYEMADTSYEAISEQKEIFGMADLKVLGLSVDRLQELADSIGCPNHHLAVDLWKSNIFEARLMACMFADIDLLTKERIYEMAVNISSWVLIDFCCAKVISRSPLVKEIAVEWAESDNDKYIYSGFRLIASLAVTMEDDDPDAVGFFDSTLHIARKQASNDNSHVSRSVSSALKMIGTRGASMRESAIETCREISKQPSRSAKWVASQALADLLTSDQNRSSSR